MMYFLIDDIWHCDCIWHCCNAWFLFDCFYCLSIGNSTACRCCFFYCCTCIFIHSALIAASVFIKFSVSSVSAAHPFVAIFELVRPFDHRMMPWKFRDDISNGSVVIVLTDRRTDRQTHKLTLLKTIHVPPSLREWVVMTSYWCSLYKHITSFHLFQHDLAYH